MSAVTRARSPTASTTTPRMRGAGRLWRFVDAQISTLPDQGLDKPVASISGPVAAPPEYAPRPEDQKPKPDDRRQDEKPDREPTKCSVCGKIRKEHPGRMFCKRQDDGKGRKDDQGWKKEKKGGRDKKGHRDSGKGGRY